MLLYICIDYWQMMAVLYGKIKIQQFFASILVFSIEHCSGMRCGIVILRTLGFEMDIFWLIFFLNILVFLECDFVSTYQRSFVTFFCKFCRFYKWAFCIDSIHYLKTLIFKILYAVRCAACTKHIEQYLIFTLLERFILL